VYASSSSVYGDLQESPKVETNVGKVLSPYAASKMTNELYAEAYAKNYNMTICGFRYFNVLGPKQDPEGPYAAVIPLFCKAFIEGKSPVIFGDGETSRDFNFVENAVQANIKAFELDLINNHEVFNVACGQQTSLNEMIAISNKISNKQLIPNYMPERPGDVKHSRASIDKAREILGFEPRILFQEGLENVFNWYGLNLDALK
jgi:UDP-N-acetylglucosamine 4-epimerase